MKIVALDSSGLVASVAVLEDDNLVAEYNMQYKKTHSQTLLPMLDELKKMVELDLKTVDAIAVSNGPGSFTGLRIGAATAKGLSYSLDIPIVEIGTLEGMACNLYGSDCLIVPIMDARRNQVYTASYIYENATELTQIIEPCAVSVDEMIKNVCSQAGRLHKKVMFLGDAVPVYQSEIEKMMEGEYAFAPAHMNRQRAAAFGYLAIQRLKEGKSVDCYHHNIEYLRLSQAERERNEGIRNKGSNY